MFLSTAAGIAILILGVPARGAAGAGGGGLEEKPATPASAAERYGALLKEYQAASVEFRGAGTDDERKAAVEHLDRFPPRFLELAETNPAEPIAVDALVEVVRAINAVDSLTQTAWELSTKTFPACSKDDSAARAVALLLRDHVRSEKLGPVCLRMSYGIRKEFEAFLRSALEKSPHRDVRALACLALADLLRTRVQKLDLVRDRPELAERLEGLFGKDHFDELRRQGRARISGEVEALLERAAAEYGDVKFPYGGTAGEKAEAELFEIRRLAIGSVAPDIEGDDQESRRFKLSDYRGKVVLLYFWSEY